MKLYQAAHVIQEIFKQDVVFIEFEDGSGHKFVYRLRGQAGNHFINLKNIIYQDKDNKIKNVLNRM